MRAHFAFDHFSYNWWAEPMSTRAYVLLSIFFASQQSFIAHRIAALFSGVNDAEKPVTKVKLATDCTANVIKSKATAIAYVL